MYTMTRGLEKKKRSKEEINERPSKLIKRRCVACMSCDCGGALTKKEVGRV